MKLIKKRDARGQDRTGQGPSMLALGGETIDRRTFLRRSGIGLGGAALAGTLPYAMMRKARAYKREEFAPKPGVKAEIRRSICTHCSVGCGVIAEVQNGVWTAQEPDFESPFNLGAHCCKGASVREHGMGELRLKYPDRKSVV